MFMRSCLMAPPSRMAGGGPGILPQDGEVLCKAAKPK